MRQVMFRDASTSTSTDLVTTATDAAGLVTCGDGSVVPATTGCAPAVSTAPTIIGISASKWYMALSVASAVVSGYHGIKRHNGSVWWGLLWFGLGGIFPVVTPVIAVAQGFSKPITQRSI